eukprot:Rhum_TRINITY_DN25112_c0_g1::Rhum_TRINITY_DN25112_c0_g1_i1::g.181272::m.181272
MHKVLAAAALLLLPQAAEARSVYNRTGPANTCTVTSSEAQCVYTTVVLQERNIYHMIPSGTAPAEGWPVVMLYHGWNMGGKDGWQAKAGSTSFNKVRTKAALLEAGFAVFAPDSNMFRDGGYWETNIDPYASADLAVWAQADDNRFLTALFAEMEAGYFGKVNVKKMHGIGFSSGGFMTSRMGFNYASKFLSLTVVSGGPAWCDGWWCPEDVFDSAQPQAALPSHPPTLFLHGTEDKMCYPKYSLDYEERLKKVNVVTKYVTEKCGHTWLAATPKEHLDWVKKFNQ